MGGVREKKPRFKYDRKIEVKVRLNDNEKAKLDQDVSRTGLSREAYLRKLIMGSDIKELPPMDFHKALAELRDANVMLHKIIYSLDSKGSPDWWIFREWSKKIENGIAEMIQQIYI
jgi:hypothetical protein